MRAPTLRAAYLVAAARLRQAGELHVAQRFQRRGEDLAGCCNVLAHPTLVAAIAHGADAGGARVAERLDRQNAPVWRAIASDQSGLAAAALQWVEVER